MVTFTSPMWPGIFLPLITLPGSCRCPVLPSTRCDTELPCEAFCPLKPWRFMPPWKPLPCVMPLTLTNWPGWKCRTSIRVPTGSVASGVTWNSERCARGSTPCAAKKPAHIHKHTHTPRQSTRIRATQ